MSFFSEERASELRELFFESATELLQALNEEGLELEKHPGDAEVVRQVRRTVHTLKGDSAACGYRELSDLAHELEDVLTPELAKGQNGHVAEVVLTAADTFQMMLAAYRGQNQVPSGNELRNAIRSLTCKPAEKAAQKKNGQHAPAARFQWSEYERLVISKAVDRGLKVLQVSMIVDPNCTIRAIAVEMAKKALQELGTLLVMAPDSNSPTEHVEGVEAALATSFDAEYVARKCRVPAVISQVTVEPFTPNNGTHSGAAAAIASVPIPESEPHEPDQAEIGPNTKLPTSTENIVRVDAERIDAVMNLVGELIIGKSMLTQSISEFEKLHPKDPLRSRFSDALSFQARVLNDLQKSVMKIRMVPVEQLFRRFPRVVRDISRAVNKDVELVLQGQDTDLDKGILDALAEPLAHLVRNAIDHGLEPAAERIAAGKPEKGQLRLDAYHQGNQVVIEISDDGRGIDRQRVIQKAIERRILSQEEAARMTEQESLNLIFHPGFSTAEQVTSISGRGVGMDVVKSVLDRLKGTIQIDTRPGVGTTFYLKVPLTLAIIKALLFEVAGRLYAIPLGSVVEIARAQESEVHRVDHHEVLRLRDEVLTLVRLRRLMKSPPSETKKMFVVVISIADRKFGLVVDRLAGEDELVIKALDDHLVASEFVSGASIMGDGTVVLILNMQAAVSKLGKSQAVGVQA